MSSISNTAKLVLLELRKLESRRCNFIVSPVFFEGPGREPEFEPTLRQRRQRRIWDLRLPSREEEWQYL